MEQPIICFFSYVVVCRDDIDSNRNNIGIHADSESDINFAIVTSLTCK